MVFAEAKAEQLALDPCSEPAARASDTVEVVLITVVPTVTLRMAHAVAARLHLLVLQLQLQLQLHLEPQFRPHLQPHLRIHLQLPSPVTDCAEAKAEQLALARHLDPAVHASDTVEVVLIIAAPTVTLRLGRAVAAQLHLRLLELLLQLHLEPQLRPHLQSRLRTQFQSPATASVECKVERHV
jgi:hypothetical protein